MRSSKVNIGDNILATQYNLLRNDAVGGSFLFPHQQSSPNLTLHIESGIVYVGSTRVIYAGGNSPSFSAPSVNPRIDIVTIDNAGTIAIVQGTESASPSAPAYPTNKMVICEVYNRVGETALYDDDAGGSTGYIYHDVRAFLSSPPVDVGSAQTISGAKTFSTLPTFTNTPSNGTDGANKTYVDQGVSPSGAIIGFAGSSAPAGWIICDGSAILRTTYATLFGIIGTTYGAGDGSTTFNLPDLRMRVPVGYKSGDANFGSLGAIGGEKTHVLTSGEMPSHSHSFPNGPSGSGGSAVSYVFFSNTGAAYAGPSYGSWGSAGGDAAHNNLQPFITINYIIKS
jgi:microcystin-dependent protein